MGTRDRCELSVDSGKCLFQHSAMCWRRGAAQIGGGTRAGQLERGLPLQADAFIWRERRLHLAAARGLFLLELDLFGLEAARHSRIVNRTSGARVSVLGPTCGNPAS